MARVIKMARAILKFLTEQGSNSRLYDLCPGTKTTVIRTNRSCKLHEESSGEFNNRLQKKERKL